MGWFKKQLVGTEEQIAGDISRPRIKQRRDGRWMGRWNEHEVLDADTPKDAIRRLSELAEAKGYRFANETGATRNVRILKGQG